MPMVWTKEMRAAASERAAGLWAQRRRKGDETASRAHRGSARLRVTDAARQLALLAADVAAGPAVFPAPFRAGLEAALGQLLRLRASL